MAELARKEAHFPTIRQIGETTTRPLEEKGHETTLPERQAYQILHAGFTAAPILAGVDKFTNWMVNWEKYLDPRIPRALGISGKDFMRIVGMIEIGAGIGVAAKPKLFGYVVSGWLAGIMGNLLFQKKYFDIALRDLGLALGALALARLAET